MVYGATFKFDKRALIGELETLTAKVRAEYAAGKRLDPRPRISDHRLPGLAGRRKKVVRIIEENGGWVVGYETAQARKPLNSVWMKIRRPMFYDALTEKYLAIEVCSCISIEHTASEYAPVRWCRTIRWTG